MHYLKNMSVRVNFSKKFVSRTVFFVHNIILDSSAELSQSAIFFTNA